MYLSLCF